MLNVRTRCWLLAASLLASHPAWAQSADCRVQLHGAASNTSFPVGADGVSAVATTGGSLT